jgi:L-cysteine/cystine lyase
VADTEAWLRDQVPAAALTTYLNTGAAGPLLTPAAEAMSQAARDELLLGRAAPASFTAFGTDLAALRAALAGLVGAEPDEIALTHNTTEGINVVVTGLPWRYGDRVVTTTLEHPGVTLPLYQLHRRHGVQVDFADIGAGTPDQTLTAIAEATEPRCQLLVISHVTYSTGAVLPIADIVELAHSRGVAVLVDGAQAVGAIPVNLPTLGADYYAFPGQKWLCAPAGTGGLFVRRDRLDQLSGAFVGLRSIDHSKYRPNDADSLTLAAGATRYEVGTTYRPGVVGVLAAVEWHNQHSASIFERTQAIARYCRRQAGQLASADVLTPPADMAGLVAFRLEGAEPERCVEALAQRGITIRAIPDNGSLRISCGFFNTEADIDTALGALANVQSSVGSRGRSA